MKKSLRILIPFIFLSGCSFMPETSDMVPENIVVKHRSSKPVEIVINGQLVTEGMIQVSNQALIDVLRLSIEKERLFSRVKKHTTNGFLLEVSIIGYEPPRMSGISMGATLITHWKLTNISSKDIVFEDYFKKTHVAPAMSALTAGGRRVVANGGVVKDTIDQGVTSISKLQKIR